MSLASTASLWTNENIQAQTKKRQPTIRRGTVKLRPYNDDTNLEPEEYVSQAENFQTLQKTSPSTIEETQEAQASKSDKVNEILNKITSVNSHNDGNKLADFVPLDKPTFTTEKKLHSTDANKYELNRHLEPFELLPQSLQKPKNAHYTANDTDVSNLSNYQHTYEAPPVFQKQQPYYASMGVGNSDNKLVEKINYMIHLLEEQQNEKTANITEEFILYVFLGVFVIFTIDSFTRVGKYVR